MPLPNFLIAGVSKCGTSSLYNYLRRHPDIFMPAFKEPSFLLCDSVELPRKSPGESTSDKGIIRDLNSYKGLFKKAQDQKRIGEASADYVYYFRGTIKAIKELLGDIPIIIILRNPVDRAYSSYMHLVRDNREHLSFEDGLKKEKERINKGYAPLWHYKKVGLYYRPIHAYLKAFSKVKICLFDDLVANPKMLIKDCYSFLGVDNSFTPKNLGERYARTGLPRYKFVYNLLANQNPVRSAFKPFLKTFIGIETRELIKEGIRRLFLSNKPQMKNSTRNYLISYFKEDIRSLESLINVNLSGWLE